MLVADLTEFLRATATNQRWIGLDHGSKTIGIALSDVAHTLATPHSTIARSKLANDLATLRQLCEAQNVGGIVVGYPLNTDGSEGVRCQSVRAFVRNLEGAIDLPVLLADERYSTDRAHDALMQTGKNYSQRALKKDQAAAALILQHVLDAIAKHPA